MTIAMFDYLGELDEIGPDIMGAMERVVRSGRLILGPEVERFEAASSAYLGGGHGVGVASGTDALTVALLAKGIGPGDEVITVPNTATPTATAIARTGATPVFCDVDPHTGLMDVECVERALTPRTKAVVPVHLYGNVVDVPRLMQRTNGRGLFVLEDCAQSLGAQLGNRHAGTFGHAAAFSFYPTKNLGAYGDAGLCFTRDGELADAMRQVRSYGYQQRDYAVRVGVNSRLDELQAAILNVKLARLERDVARRRELADLYDAELPPQCERFGVQPGVRHGRHLYVVRVENRAELRAALSERGVQTGVHYPHPIHHMPAFAAPQPPCLPHAEHLAQCVLSLPLHPRLTDDDVRAVCEALSEMVQGKASSRGAC